MVKFIRLHKVCEDDTYKEFLLNTHYIRMVSPMCHSSFTEVCLDDSKTLPQYIVVRESYEEIAAQLMI